MPFCDRHKHNVAMVAIHINDSREQDKMCMDALVEHQPISDVQANNYRFVKDRGDGIEMRMTTPEIVTALQEAESRRAPERDEPETAQEVPEVIPEEHPAPPEGSDEAQVPEVAPLVPEMVPPTPEIVPVPKLPQGLPSAIHDESHGDKGTKDDKNESTS